VVPLTADERFWARSIPAEYVPVWVLVDDPQENDDDPRG
jgi:hypothetical protein